MPLDIHFYPKRRRGERHAAGGVAALHRALALQSCAARALPFCCAAALPLCCVAAPPHCSAAALRCAPSLLAGHSVCELQDHTFSFFQTDKKRRFFSRTCRNVRFLEKHSQITKIKGFAIKRVLLLRKSCECGRPNLTSWVSSDESIAGTAVHQKG